MTALAEQAAKEGVQKPSRLRSSHASHSSSSGATSILNAQGDSSAAPAGFAASVADEGVTALRRFDSSLDELRYSLRSVVRHMSWFNKLYLVTSGQVPSWLNLSNPRVTVVPHSSIFQEPDDLPTFNSAAIEANVHRIPGLSQCYVVFNDDFFLTRQVTRSFFVTPEGGEYIYNAWKFTDACYKSSRECAQDTFGASLRYVNALFNAKFRWRNRQAQSHMMHFVQKKWMERLQADFPAEYRATSSHHFRSSQNMQFAAAYKWYLIERGHAHEQLPPKHRTLFIPVTVEDVARIHRAVEAAWARPDIAVVCLNDERSSSNVSARAEVNIVLGNFLQNAYPEPSEFELRDGMVDSCSGHLTSSYGTLPDEKDVHAVCSIVRSLDPERG
jgi:hypothetical protein